MRPSRQTRLTLLVLSTCVFASAPPISAKERGSTGYVIRYSDTQSEANTEIMIRATPAQVWSVLTDFQSMPNWSSSFKGITGDVRNGGNVLVRYQLGPNIVEYPYVLTYAEGSAFAWSAPLTGLKGFTDNHRFAVVPLNKRMTRFVQRDGYTGESSLPGPDGQPKPLSAQEFATMQVENFAKFNQELKAEVEKRFPPHQRRTPPKP